MCLAKPAVSPFRRHPPLPLRFFHQPSSATWNASFAYFADWDLTYVKQHSSRELSLSQTCGPERAVESMTRRWLRKYMQTKHRPFAYHSAIGWHYAVLEPHHRYFHCTLSYFQSTRQTDSSEQYRLRRSLTRGIACKNLPPYFSPWRFGY